MDPEADTKLFGWIVASLSITMVISGPAFGAISNHYKSFKWPLVASLCFGVAGAIVYADVEFFPPRRGYYILLARLLKGIRAGRHHLLSL